MKGTIPLAGGRDCRQPRWQDRGKDPVAKGDQTLAASELPNRLKHTIHFYGPYSEGLQCGDRLS